MVIVDIIKKIKADYKGVNDLNISVINNKTLVYLESICSSDKINNYIIDNINDNKEYLNKITGPKVKKITMKQYQTYLNDGYILIIDNNIITAIEVKENNFRDINTPEIQISYNGPKDSFNENYLTNLSLIKKRLKTNKLKSINHNIGKYTKTMVSILYLEDIVKMDNVNKVNDVIKDINIDGILDSSYIAQYLEKNKKNAFAPRSFKTERPDYVCNALLNGKIAILVDNSPNALILPAFLLDFINPPLDNYSKPILINSIKALRMMAFLITLTLPAFYIALTNYNQETIPLNLLLSLSTARSSVPFPSIFEALIMLFIYELLRESDIHFPKNFGSANSILGALILGEASVKAGIVSPIMIIIIAVTFISSLIFSDIDFINAIRRYRLLFLISAALLGLFGIMIMYFYFVTRVLLITSLDYPYTFPLVPFDKSYFNVFHRTKIFKDKIRSKYLSNNHIKER